MIEVLTIKSVLELTVMLQILTEPPTTWKEFVAKTPVWADLK